MTFHRIGDNLDRRRTFVETLRVKSEGAADTARKFLEECYGSVTARQCGVLYKDSTLTIQVPTKKIANEVTLRSGELAAVVRAEHFPLKRIVIR